MDVTERTHDVISGSDRLEDLHTLPDFPVFMGSVLHDRSEDLTFDMSWSISKDTGIIQLKKLLPLDVLYQSQTTTSAVGALWMEHHRAFADFVSQYAPGSVLELGGAHGILAKEYEKFASIPWTILEPNPAPLADTKARFIKGFFDDRFVLEQPIDTVIHSHVYEHLYEPDRFTRHLAGFVAEGQRMIFAVPHLSAWLDKKFTNCINFEHTVFLTEPYIEHLLAKHGFRLERKSYFKTDHSIFYACIRDSSVQAIPLDPKLYELNKTVYRNFVSYHEALIADLNDRISKTDKPVYLFGAHVFAQYLLAFGLRTDKIIGLLDNDAKKQGKRLYGTGLTVHSPRVLQRTSNPAVILKAGVYNDEIKADILNNINASTEFFE
jgi:hypothetical protein